MIKSNRQPIRLTSRPANRQPAQRRDEAPHMQMSRGISPLSDSDGGEILRTFDKSTVDQKNGRDKASRRRGRCARDMRKTACSIKF